MKLAKIGILVERTILENLGLLFKHVYRSFYVTIVA